MVEWVNAHSFSWRILSCQKMAIGGNMSKVTERVLALAEPVAAECGCEVWDVEYVREAGSW